MTKPKLTEQQIWLLEQLDFGRDPDRVLFRQLTWSASAWFYEIGDVQPGGMVYRLDGTPKQITRPGLSNTVLSLLQRSVLSAVGDIGPRMVIIVNDTSEVVKELLKARGLTCSN